MTDVVQKLWGFCHTLRHDGIDYGDYIEQITYLLFLKMAEERRIDLTDLRYKAAQGKEVKVDCSWGIWKARQVSPSPSTTSRSCVPSASSGAFWGTSSAPPSRASPTR
jgi:hypothetical protein